jgi:hypothetical protein
MSNIANVSHAIPLVKKSYQKLLSFGEGATSDDFRMTIDLYPDLEFLIQTTQLPPIAREPIESFGPHGVQFVQAGRYKNAQEVSISFKEVLSGVVYAALRDWVRNKRYLTVMLGLVAESERPVAKSGGQPNQRNTVVMYDTWIELEGVDLSVEDATIVKPTGTLHANWLDYLDETGMVVGWGL